MAPSVAAAAQATNALPTAVIAAWIAAVAALAATVLSFFGSWFHQRRALQHDATQRDRDRAMALRRDVYLPAAEAITRLQAVLGQLLDIDAKLPELGRQFVESLSALFKIHLVAGEDTVRPVMEYVSAYMPAYLDLVAARSRLVITKSAIDVEASMVQRAAAEMDSYVQQMKEFNLAGSRDAQFFARLNDGLTREREDHRRHAEQQAALYRQLQAQQLDIVERLTRLLPELSARIPDALLAARDELGLPIDQQEYRRLFRLQQEAAVQVMQRVVAEARQQAAGQR